MENTELEKRAIQAAQQIMDFDILDDKALEFLSKVYMQAKIQESCLFIDELGDFGQAINSLKAGKKVARKGWNGKGMYLWLKSGVTIQKDWCKDPMLLEVCEANGGSVEGLPTICMKTADNKILTGWLASQTDMLSNDWVLVD